MKVAFSFRGQLNLLPFLIGGMGAFGLAPFSFFPAALLSLAGLFFALNYRVNTPRAAAYWSFQWGIGYALVAFYWLYISLHDIGHMPALLAGLAVLVFCAYNAAFGALAVYTAFRVQTIASSTRLGILLPLFWCFAEALRGVLFTGFPWGNLGYAFVESPFKGLFPLVGSFGVFTLMVWGIALLFVRPVMKKAIAAYWCVLSLAGLWGTAGTHLVGTPLTVQLVQGHVLQQEKWLPEQLQKTLSFYQKAANHTSAEITLLPETALPIFFQDLPISYLEQFQRPVLVGAPAYTADKKQYLNSVFFLNKGQVLGEYHKTHLVPFGEFIPLRPLLAPLVERLAIPLTDFARGNTSQPPFSVGNQKLMMTICYEDIFGHELIDAAKQASILVNVNNLAWFGDSSAMPQHLQIGQARALELGRPMLRVGNSGITALISEQGDVLHRLPVFKTASLQVTVQGRMGESFYMKYGHLLVFLVICALSGWILKTTHEHD